MSVKNKIKKLLNSGNPDTPRALPEIQKEHNQLCYEAGARQYKISILKAELDQINNRLRDVNTEAAKRNELDAKAQEAKKNEAKSE